MMKRLIFLIILLRCTIALSAQESERMRGIYEEASQAYAIGRLEQAQQMLKDNINKFSTGQGGLKENAYRLLALCSIGLGKEEEAEYYTQLLLSENPYFSKSLNDPPRFIDMIEKYSGYSTSTITTASSRAEDLKEVPVPVTLITDEMIRACSARNLKDVLLAYVPGMNNVDCNNDINVAMRGIYSNGQEKILILLNGHRLNSYCSNTAAPDFSISLENVKQIEVLRGPASSLYGGVALTAVVNIITKQGADIDGVRVKLGAGNFGQMKGDVVFGKRYFDLDVLFWGSLYKSSGQKFHIPVEETGLRKYGGDVTVGGVGNNPSYDMGLTIKWKRLSFMYKTSSSQIILPFTASYTHMPYSIDSYKTFNGYSPSLAAKSHHVDLRYNRQIGNLNLEGSLLYDNRDLTHYQVISDSALDVKSREIPRFIKDMFKFSQGSFRYINGQEETIGGQVRGDFVYTDNQAHQGLLTFGAQYSYFDLKDVRYAVGMDFNMEYENPDIPKIGKGHEQSFNTYVQLKHKWKSLILNAGVRFDHIRHYDNNISNVLSPRVAAIFVRDKWNIKFSYSKSFVDAPYLYRKTNNFLTSFNDEESTQAPEQDLNSEILHSYQITLSGTQWIKGLNLELNGFYNRATNLIYSSLLTHENAGTMKNIGIEFTGNYRRNRLFSNLTVSWQHVMQSEVYGENLNTAYFIPDITINAVMAYKLTNNLMLNGHILFEGPQDTSWIDLTQETPTLIEGTLSSRVLMDMGVRYTIGPVELGVNFHNLLNKSYYRGGMGIGLIPQMGRNFMIHAAVKI